ncbi:helix-turn-helix transcriptional regulator [Streptomyces marinisediminis]|uniref:helix-turn-helix transcriptional regulator n=1 Tax=Streptomyces marinisediminis TaxID=2984864 RepID=UPI0022491176|nr:helix-turn-helix transcriptional regulator [Streptomyces sp. JHD 1]MCX2969547.1 helix-turn-helix transcriptional regulator [Streptomyces sp. JHD 1]
MLRAVLDHLDSGRDVVLTGPRGIGASALLRAALAAARARGDLALHCAGTDPARHPPPLCTPADLLAQLPPGHGGSAGRGPAGSAASGSLASGSAASGSLASGSAVAGPGAAGAAAEDPALPRTDASPSPASPPPGDHAPVLLLVDDAHRLCPGRATALVTALHHRTGRPVRTVLAGRWPGAPDDGPPWPPDAVRVPLPPLDTHALADLLAPYALPLRLVSGLHADSGGNPGLALALAAGLTDRPPQPGRPAPLTETPRALVADRLAALPHGVRETLLAAALAVRPTVDLLIRAGRPDAERDLRAAAATGLVTTSDGPLRFTPPGVAAVLSAAAPAPHRARWHRALAAASPDSAGRLRHQALATARPDAHTARSLATAAATAHAKGDLHTAADLSLLAADLTPPAPAPGCGAAPTTPASGPRRPGPGAPEPVPCPAETPPGPSACGAPPVPHPPAPAPGRPPSARSPVPPPVPSPAPPPGASPAETDRLDRLVAAAEAGAAASLHVIAHRAADAVLAADARPRDRVRVRLALLDLAGPAPADGDETFAAALLDAADTPELLAPLRLRLSRAALRAGHLLRAEAEADRAVRHARSAADAVTEAMALTGKATVAHLAGRSDHHAHLTAALRLPAALPPGHRHHGPRFLAARLALHTDRLTEAREAGLTLLALAERGSGEEAIALLCHLAETSARAGRCREALDFADRAVRATERAAHSPAPAWYAAAVAELAGGSVARAATHAERGVLACEQEGDVRHLTGHLHALGQARLRTGDLRGAVRALERLRDLEDAHGVRAPHVLRWHADHAAALTALGSLGAAEELIDATRASLAAAAHGATTVTAQLDRADAALHAARGDTDAALALLDAAESRFAASGQPLEHGQTLLERGRIERRRRRYAAARRAVADALALFTRHAARSWTAQAGHGPDPHLTDHESRIAALVTTGATNQEVAAHLFLSVKTVEASLTRIYRKLGIRSRTELTGCRHATRPHPPETGSGPPIPTW